MSKFLNGDGVLYLWGKIKTYVAGVLPKKVSELTNDAKYITAADVPEGAAASNTPPKENGTANAGTENAFARGDHVHPHDSSKVDKVSGKGLSTNDFTTAEKDKLAGIATGANNYTLPTAGSALGGVKTTSTVSNANGYTPAPIISGVVYYKDTNTTYNDATQSTHGLLSAADKKKLDGFGDATTYATTSYVGQQIAAAGHIKKQIVTALPSTTEAKDNIIYMIAKTTANGDNAYDEYMLVNGALERIGDTQADIDVLSNTDIDALIAKAQ